LIVPGFSMPSSADLSLGRSTQSPEFGIDLLEDTRPVPDPRLPEEPGAAWQPVQEWAPVCAEREAASTMGDSGTDTFRAQFGG
jgi:hypothetical protein